MAISAYTGLPGHGKSYGAVENVIVPALKAKRQVFTNIPMKEENCLKNFDMAPTQFSTQDIIDNPDWWSDVFVAGSVIIIDELWRLWPSGMKANNVRESDKTFLAEHRHLVGENGAATEIVFVTQDLSQIASFARSLVETTYRVTKLSKLGFDKRFRVDIYFGPVTGPSPPQSKRDRELYGSFEKQIGDLYHSHTKSATGEAGDETRIDNRFNVLKGNKVKAFFIIFLLLVFGVWQGATHFLKDYGSTNEPEQPQAIEVISQLPQQQNTPATEPVFQFLADADSIIIAFNNGIWPNIEYRYKVSFESMEAVLDYSDMQRLGYELEPVNQCMVRIKGADYSGFAMCAKEEVQNDWVDEIIPIGDAL